MNPTLLHDLVAAEQERSARSLVALAAAIGCSKATLWRWCTGKREPRRQFRGRLAAELHVDAELLAQAIANTAADAQRVVA